MRPVLTTHRHAIARLLLAAAIGALAALVVAPAWRRAPGPERPEVAGAPEGATLRGVRHVRWRGTTPGLAVSARRVRVERSRLGPFRIGFARTVVADDVRIDLPAAAGLRPATASGHGAPAGAATAVTSVRAHRLHLRLQGRDGDRLELHAGRCEASLLGAGRVVCDQTVRLVGPGFARTVDALAWDPAGRRLSAPRATPGTQAALDAANAVLARMGAPDLAALRAGLAPML